MHSKFFDLDRIQGRRTLRRVIGTLGRLHDRITTLRKRVFSKEGRRLAAWRKVATARLHGLADSRAVPVAGRVLVDGTFDNPNFWLRWSLLRAALGLRGSTEIGLVGPYSRKRIKTTFDRFGVRQVFDAASPARNQEEVERHAARLLAMTKDPGDVLEWSLPEGLPPAIVYDSILKRQRLAALDPNHPSMPGLTREALTNIERVREILDETKPDLVIASHPIGMICGPLVWLALARGIPVIHVFGLFGVLRFACFRKPADMFEFYDRPSAAEIDSLPSETALALGSIGRDYLAGRMSGKADDLASVYAFQRSASTVERDQICQLYGWDPAKPIVGVYASNWFDWPHQLGMSNFRDFLDWTSATFEEARRNTGVNWLFKPHPAEDWFGGVRLAEILRGMDAGPNVAVAEKAWNAAAVMRSIDALVTYHGTAGIEFAAQGGAVLLPDRGKYDASGFALMARSREDYLALLQRPWWRELDLEASRRRAQIFAGWWFCAPAWQEKFVLADDSRQEVLYEAMPELLDGNWPAVERELSTLRSWWDSGEMHYHTRKMRLAGSYQLSNLG